MDFIETGSDTLDVLLHGAGGGMNHSNMKKVFDVCVGLGHSVVNFNFPFFERGDEHSSGPELVEEIDTLKKVLTECNIDQYKHVRLIGKSLGAIIAAKYLSTLTLDEQKKFSVVIFGYDTRMINISTFPGKISIIQGEKDKYGNIEVVRNDLKGAASKDISYFEVPNADHSYRNEQKEPVYEDEAIDLFSDIGGQATQKFILNKTSRIIGADLIRVLAMLMVIYIHTIYSFTMRLDFFVTKAWFVFEPFTALSKTSMILFFTLSGYLVIGKKRTIKENFVIIKNRILIPLISFTFIYALLQVFILKLPIISGLERELLAALPHFPTNWLWFLVVLFFLYLSNPLWQNIFSQSSNSRLANYLVKTLMLFTVVTITIKFLTNDTYFFNSFTSWLGYLGFYLYGGSIRNKWFNINNIKLNLALVVLGLGLIIAGDYYTILAQTHSQHLLLAGYFNDYLSIPVILCALGIFNLIMSNSGESVIKKYINGTKLKILQMMAILSFGIYLIHPIIVGVLSGILGVSIDNMRVNIYLYNFAYFSVVLLTSTLVAYIILKIPKLNLILGAK